MEINEFADFVADTIDEYGWTQFRDGTPETGFCVIGAALHVQKVQDINCIPFVRNFRTWMGIRGVSMWNDAPGRTQEEVVLNIRKFADELRSEDAAVRS